MLFACLTLAVFIAYGRSSLAAVDDRRQLRYLLGKQRGCGRYAEIPTPLSNLLKIEMTLGPKPLVGKEALLDYLMTMQDLMMPLERRQQYARDWLLQLDSRTSLSLALVTFNESQLEEFPH